MEIIGYYIHGNKEYVAFKDVDDERPDRFKITDGFHDRPVNERNRHKYKEYKQVKKKDIDLHKIIGRMKGTRPWHPLLDALKKEIVA
jgi:hypothetical protein